MLRDWSAFETLDMSISGVAGRATVTGRFNRCDTGTLRRTGEKVSRSRSPAVSLRIFRLRLGEEVSSSDAAAFALFPIARALVVEAAWWNYQSNLRLVSGLINYKDYRVSILN